MRMSDRISSYIISGINSADSGSIELQRNILAAEIGCVPSQINYVLSSRFTPEQGYFVESRRGGGGYIRITRIRFENESSEMAHLMRVLPISLSESGAVSVIQQLYYKGLIQLQTAHAMIAAVSDKVMIAVSVNERNVIRSSLLKHMIAALHTDRAV